MKQITKILGILVIAIIIFAGKLFFLPNSIAKTKDNISRVESSDNYSITFNELVSLLEETAKKEKIEVKTSNRTVTLNKKKYFKSTLYLKTYLIEGLSKEKDGKLVMVKIYSPLGKFKSTTRIEFNESLIKNFRRYATLLNNVLNSDKNQKEVLEFLTKQTGKKIAPARKNIDNFTVSLSVSGKSLVVTFRPQ